MNTRFLRSWPLLLLALADPSQADPVPVTLDGKALFFQSCAKCHGKEGKGKFGWFPPLRNSDFLAADKARAVRVVARGLSGPIIVNGRSFNGTMPAQFQKPEEIAAVLTYVMVQLGGDTTGVSTEDVIKVLAKST